MSRDSNGNFSLAAGNPVASNTVIQPAWANTTLSDVAAALTDSLSRSGSGKMLAPLGSVSGTVALPGLAFLDELNSGFYRAGANDIRLSVAGVDRIRVTPTALTITEATTTLTGNLVAVGGAFSGNVSGVNGAFTGPVSGTTGTFTGAVAGTTGTFSGAVSGATGAFSGAVSGTTGTFSSTVSGVSGVFSGALSGTTGTFTGLTTGPSSWFGNTGGTSGISCFEQSGLSFVMATTRASPTVPASTLGIQGTAVAIASTVSSMNITGANSLTLAANAGNVNINSTFGSVVVSHNSVLNLQNSSASIRLQISTDLVFPNLPSGNGSPPGGLPSGAVWRDTSTNPDTVRIV
jgi:hypothetical protein